MTASVVLSAEAPLEPQGLRDAAHKMVRTHQWAKATSLLDRALALLGPGNNPLKRAEIVELSALCRFAWAFRAETRQDFEERMREAKATYQSASILFESA